MFSVFVQSYFNFITITEAIRKHKKYGRIEIQFCRSNPFLYPGTDQIFCSIYFI